MTGRRLKVSEVFLSLERLASAAVCVCSQCGCVVSVHMLDAHINSCMMIDVVKVNDEPEGKART